MIQNSFLHFPFMFTFNYISSTCWLWGCKLNKNKKYGAFKNLRNWLKRVVFFRKRIFLLKKYKIPSPIPVQYPSAISQCNIPHVKWNHLFLITLLWNADWNVVWMMIMLLQFYVSETPIASSWSLHTYELHFCKEFPSNFFKAKIVSMQASIWQLWEWKFEVFDKISIISPIPVHMSNQHWSQVIFLP